MGENRTEHKNESPAEIPIKLRELFHITNDDAYYIWASYQARKMTGLNSSQAIDSLMKNLTINENHIIYYFAALGLELVNVEILKGSHVGQFNGN